jgi:hypothetical protein
MIYTPQKFYSDDQRKKNEMSEACSTYGKREEGRTGFSLGNLSERVYLEESGTDARIMLRRIF